MSRKNDKNEGVPRRKTGGSRVAGVPSAKKRTARSSRPSTRSRIEYLEERVAYLDALATKNEYERFIRGIAQGVSNAIMSKKEKEVDMEFLHKLGMAVGLYFDLKFEALGARKAATKERVPAPRRTEPKASLKGTGASRATPKTPRQQ